MGASEHAAALRVIDASLNRAAEGLRTVEDYLRFALDDAHLSGLAKQLRHDLAAAGVAFPQADRLGFRDTVGDVGVSITTEAEGRREDLWQVCSANQERLQQALRCVEEYAKVVSPADAGAFEQLRYRAYTLGKAVAATRNANERLSDTRLYVLVDGRESAEAFDNLVTTLLGAGVDAIQLRDKSLADGVLLERARRLVELSRTSNAVAIVNDRADVAAASGADGVHVGQDDLPVSATRAIVGPGRLVGVSTHSLDQLRRAVLDGADYVGVGPTFPTETKSFDAFPGLDYVRAAAQETALPAFAIGGINADNLPNVVEAGAKRVAVASAVTTDEDPTKTARRLKSLLLDAARPPVGNKVASN